MSKELHHLFNAITKKDLKQIHVAIKDNQSLINAKDDKGNTALTIAADHGNVEAVNTLVKHGAHINYQIPGKLFTPLMLAVTKGHNEVVKYLLINGADKNIVDAHGKTALDHAQEGKKQPIIDLFKSK